MGKILDFAKQYNICFITNGWKGELGEKCKSFFGSEYEDLVTNRRFEVFFGQYDSNILDDRENYQPITLFYGKEVFCQLLSSKYFLNNFEYLLYIDEDLFIYDWDVLIELIDSFHDSEFSIMAPPDGGVLCHRMRCSEVMPNTFLCCFKCKDFRDIDFKESEIDYYKTRPEYQYQDWYKENKKNANILRKEIFNFRKDKENLYTELVLGKQYNSFPYTKKLVINENDKPYVMLNSEESRFNCLSKYNYHHIDTEPYYNLFYYLMSKDLKIYYIFVTDLYKDEYNKVIDDYGGVASELYYGGVPFAVHTWLSRIYINNEKFYDNYERINKIYEYAKIKLNGFYI